MFAAAGGITVFAAVTAPEVKAGSCAKCYLSVPEANPPSQASVSKVEKPPKSDLGHTGLRKDGCTGAGCCGGHPCEISVPRPMREAGVLPVRH